MFQSIRFTASNTAWGYILVDSQFTDQVNIEPERGSSGLALFNYAVIDGCAVIEGYRARKYSDSEIIAQLVLFLISHQERYGQINFKVAMNILQLDMNVSYLLHWTQAVQQMQNLSSFL